MAKSIYFKGPSRDPWQNYAAYLKRVNNLPDDATAIAHALSFRFKLNKGMNGMGITTYNEFLKLTFTQGGKYVGRRRFRKDFFAIHDEETGVVTIKLGNSTVGEVIAKARPDGLVYFPDLSGPTLDVSIGHIIKTQVNKFIPPKWNIKLCHRKGVLHWKKMEQNGKVGLRKYQEGDGFFAGEFSLAEQRNAAVENAEQLVGSA